MHCKQWIFDMDGTLTDSMVVVWEGAPEALLARFGRTPKADLHETLLTMGMETAHSTSSGSMRCHWTGTAIWT
mgnify:FL=1